MLSRTLIFFSLSSLPAERSAGGEALRGLAKGPEAGLVQKPCFLRIPSKGSLTPFSVSGAPRRRFPSYPLRTFIPTVEHCGDRQHRVGPELEILG